MAAPRAKWFHPCSKDPELIAEEELLDYFIFRQDQSGWAPPTMRICYSDIKFFFKHVGKCDWHLLSLSHAKQEGNCQQGSRIFLRVRGTFQQRSWLFLPISGTFQRRSGLSILSI
jgi:hypothetical protein